MRKILIVAVAATVGLAAIELVSSYVYFHHYVGDYQGIHPNGSMAAAMIGRAYDKFRGISHQVKMSIDHGPLFAASDTLGFTILPGRYKVTEHFEGRKHVFDLTVTDAGRRASSYAPVKSSKRLLITGDSALFGWGLDDEGTVPWLMQSRLPDYEVVNLSLNSYSTVHALLQLQQLVPGIGPDDIVVLEYHPASNDFNVANMIFLRNFLSGYEVQLGDTAQLRAMKVPFGMIDAGGGFSIGRIRLSCAVEAPTPECVHPIVSPDVERQVTERAFDEIIALNIRHLVVALISGADDDPVIVHLRSRGLMIADLRTVDGVPEDLDVIPTDKHSGPFWHRQAYGLLLQALQHYQLVK
jgi:hypothetical protein